MHVVALITLLVALPAASWVAAPACGAEPPPSPAISVDAEGKVMARPDLATLILEVETQAAGAEAAAADNARRADSLLAALKKLLGPDEKIQTLGFRLTPVRSSKDKSRPPEITGYQAVHRFRVEIRELGRLGTVIDTSLKSGASQVQGPSWGHSRLEELQREAAVDALGRARRLAEALAQAAGLKIKGVEKISTGIRVIFPRAGGEVFAAAPLAGPTPIEVGEEEIKAQIQAVFGLQP